MKNKWKGWIIDESLKDRTILSQLKVIKIIREENTEAGKKVIWDLYTVEIDDENIEKTTSILQEIVKPDYYMHFTNGKELLITFYKKSFRMAVEKVGKEKEVGITSFKIKSSDKKIWHDAV